jgi:hypothetical protein
MLSSEATMLKYLRVAWSVACSAAIIVVAGCDTPKKSTPVTNTSDVVAERPKPANELPLSIPLASIVSTSGQRDLEDASSGMKNGEYVVPYGQYLRQLYEGWWRGCIKRISGRRPDHNQCGSSHHPRCEAIRRGRLATHVEQARPTPG